MEKIKVCNKNSFNFSFKESGFEIETVFMIIQCVYIGYLPLC